MELSEEGLGSCYKLLPGSKDRCVITRGLLLVKAM